MLWDAVVLAGGRGSRLGGVDKATLELDGSTLLGRTLAALAGAARVSPPRAALIFSISRLLRRLAALGWMAPTLAARSRAESATTRASRVGSVSPVSAEVRALATYVLAAVRRGWSTARRLAA